MEAINATLTRYNMLLIVYKRVLTDLWAVLSGCHSADPDELSTVSAADLRPAERTAAAEQCVQAGALQQQLYGQKQEIQTKMEGRFSSNSARS